MRIAYVANHGCGGNQDEDAITHALRVLGHSVTRLSERGVDSEQLNSANLILSHKWNPEMAQEIHTKKVFWYFDLVHWEDDSLARRNLVREKWMLNTIPQVDLGFCTDGDWVRRVNLHGGYGNKLVWLPQGADERIVMAPYNKIPSTTDNNKSPTIPILFTGIRRKGGTGRTDFVDWVQENYGERFIHIEKGMYRQNLKQMIGRTGVVLGADSPVTDNYWSNRVYNVCGFGACMLHPCCEKLTEQYEHDKEIIYYTSKKDLKSKIDYLLDPSNADYRKAIGDAALKRTRKEHLYRHRCQELLKVVAERLGVGA